jgi:hypothetical protein
LREFLDFFSENFRDFIFSRKPLECLSNSEKSSKKNPKKFPLHPTVKFKKYVKENSFDPFENLIEENRKLESYSYLGMLRGRLNNPSFPVPQGNKKEKSHLPLKY